MGAVILRNGVEMPNLCFGTGIGAIYGSGLTQIYYGLKSCAKLILRHDAASRTSLTLNKLVHVCMENGCTAFDTSRAYGASEQMLGRALKRYPRETYFVITKLCNTDQFRKQTPEGFEKSLSELSLEYVDLYLMHWPVEGLFPESWKEMERIYESGRCRAIGVCNFHAHHLEELSRHAKIMPMVNEFECHPLLTQNALREYCRQREIQVMAYTSTARMDERLKKTCLVPLAKKYGKTVAQIILRWHIQIGNVPIVNSTNSGHMISNIKIDDFALTEDEVANITAINIDSRLRYDPDNCDFTQL